MPVSPAADVVRTFYDAFARRDHRTMASCYSASEAIVFSDPIFRGLTSREAGAMWAMLLSGAREFRLSYEVLEVSESRARIRWIASYAYNGRPIVNRVESDLALGQGKIVRHEDRFDLWRWSIQAFGPLAGRAFALLAPVTIRPKARRALIRFMERTRE